MDDLTTLRRLDAGAPDPTDAALARARTALEERMHLPQPTGTPARRLATRRGVVLTGLGVAAAACVAVVLVDLGPAPSASAASRTLQAAATAVAAGGTGTTGTRVHYTRLVTSAAPAVDGEQAPGTGVLLTGTRTLHRQHDSDVWVRSSSPLQPIAAWGPDRARQLQRDLDEYAAAEGRWTTERSSDSDSFWDITPKQVAALPRTPAELTRRLQGVTDPDSALVPDTERAIDTAGTVLESGLADAELQAAVYRALGRLPGLTLQEHARDLDGRSGVGISTVVSDGQQRIEIVIDPATGRFLGRTETNLRAMNGAPAGTAYESTAVHPD